MFGSFLHFLDGLATPRDPFDRWGIMDYVSQRQGQHRWRCYNVNYSVKTCMPISDWRASKTCLQSNSENQLGARTMRTPGELEKRNHIRSKQASVPEGSSMVDLHSLPNTHGGLWWVQPDMISCLHIL